REGEVEVVQHPRRDVDGQQRLAAMDADSLAAERIQRLLERQHDLGRVLALSDDHLDDSAVLAERCTGGARQCGLLVELGRPTDETRERLEVPELQICGLAEEAVKFRGELGEVDSRRAAVLSASAQGKRT